MAPLFRCRESIAFNVLKLKSSFANFNVNNDKKNLLGVHRPAERQHFFQFKRKVKKNELKK